MTPVTITLGNATDEALATLYRYQEYPRRTALADNGLNDPDTTSMTLVSAQGVAPSTVLEVDDELILVTEKSTDPTPVFTVIRRYGDTDAAAHPQGTAVGVSPQYARAHVKRNVQRAVSTALNSLLPNIVSISTTRVPGYQYVQLATNVIKVLSVRHLNALTGRISDLGGWRFEEDIPTTLVASGKALRVPSYIQDGEDIIVTYQTPYAWSGSGDAATLDLPVAAEDLPSLWAAAYTVARKEVSRLELDRVEEWQHREAAVASGANVRMVRELWAEWYRRLDEARDLQYVPRHRPFRPKAKTWRN